MFVGRAAARRGAIVQRTNLPPSAHLTPDAADQETGRDDALLDGFFVGGFECSDHRIENGRRLDLLAATAHDRLAAADYALLRGVGIGACREGVSWVRCEARPGHFDFTSLLPRIEAARTLDVRVAWDLMHFGWPDDVDIFDPGFPARFGRYARAFARWLADHSDRRWLFTPVNEMSFLAWAGGDMRILNPFAAGRGVELKAQLVLATIEAIEAIRSVFPDARFLHPEPIITIHPHPEQPKTWRRVECDNLLQYQAWDMLCGTLWPRLGGDPKYLDIIGVNFYPDNQFMLDGTTIHRGDERYRPFSAMLLEVAQRYGRPVLISETGTEGDARGPWLDYIADECVAAMEAGCELHGATLYPILDHPGWVDDRHCPNGLWGYPEADGRRSCHQPLAEALARHDRRLCAARSAMLARRAAARAPLSRSVSVAAS